VIATKTQRHKVKIKKDMIIYLIEANVWVSQFGELARNGIYNLNVLVKQTVAQNRDIELPFIRPERNLSKIEKCTSSSDFPPNAIYVIDGKLADSGYLHKNVQVEDIDKLEVMETEITKAKMALF